jgi:hypothetical protein
MLFSDLEDDDEPIEKQNSGDVGSDQSKGLNESDLNAQQKGLKLNNRKKSVMSYAIASD